MVFLKKFKAIGFKSFANNVEINFNEDMVGIVGPNGSGKSNIVDAIKWVLGEKSNKNLRGKVSSDVIFHGSTEKEESPFAKISLYFNNESRRLDVDADEVKITRKLTRATLANEYFLNDNPCRLKDIHELFLDTGLAKGSLGIISQGTVQWFVETKAEDRRKIFEDAAGIGMYSKRKIEAVSQLNSATENLDRISDHVSLLERDLKKLEKQAEKAKEFATKQEQLKELDIIILVKDITFYQQKIDELSQSILTLKEDVKIHQKDVDILDNDVVDAKQKVNTSDTILDSLNDELSNLIEMINKLEIKRQAIETKAISDLSSDNTEKRINAYKQIITSLDFELSEAKAFLEKINNEMLEYEEIKKQKLVEKNVLLTEVSALSAKITDQKYTLKNIKDAIHNQFNNEFGVKSILDNRNVLPGIHGTLKTFLSTEEKYEKSILTALGRAANFIVVDKQDDAKYAIDFLKQNRAGRATFLPIDKIQPKSIKFEHETILNKVSGYISTAFSLIDCKDTYSNIFSSFLSRVLICENMDGAILSSKYTFSNYQTITLDGDVIAPGGAMSGGYSKKSLNFSINLEEKETALEGQIQSLEEQLIQKQMSMNEYDSVLSELGVKLQEKYILSIKYKDKIENSTTSLFKHKTELEQLDTSYSEIDKKLNWTVSEIDEKLSIYSQKKDRVNQDININRHIKLTNKQTLDISETKLSEIRGLVNTLQYDLAKNEADFNKAKNIVFMAKERVNNDYAMTLEFAIANYNRELPISEEQARTTIITLRADLKRIGGVNMEAFNEMESKQKEFDLLSNQQKEMIEARDKIVATINDLDNKAKESFSTTINKVNESLPKIFKYLFGGGNCFVQYSNPDDILTSGIEIIANPPGKKITNLNLLSGGEKTLVALSILFAILTIHQFPLVILDEAESALDPANVERFGNIIKANSGKTQFLAITHRPGTMDKCEILYGATMQSKGITNMYKVSLAKAKEYVANKEKERQ